jgi:outer membrane receptor protein involved in Fe transport
VFFELESALAEWATLRLGLRLQTHSRFDEAVLPQVAFMLTPHETLKVRLSWGENQRNPSLRDLYQPPSPQLGGSYFLAGNPELQPESSQSWRAGFEWSPIRQASFSVVGFWNDFDDSIRSVLDDTVVVGSNVVEENGALLPTELEADFLELCSDALVNFRLPGCQRLAGGGAAGIISTPITSNLFRKQNLDAVRTRGLEVRLDVRPHARLELELGYTLLDTEVRDSDRPDLRELPNEPKHVATARLYATLPWSETQVAIESEWRDRAIIETSGTGLLGFSDSATLSQPAFLLNLRIAQPVWRRVEVFLDARNLTDERIIDSYPIRGRTFFVGVRARFHPSFDLARLARRGLRS